MSERDSVQGVGEDARRSAQLVSILRAHIEHAGKQGTACIDLSLGTYEAKLIIAALLARTEPAPGEREREYKSNGSYVCRDCGDIGLGRAPAHEADCPQRAERGK